MIIDGRGRVVGAEEGEGEVQEVDESESFRRHKEQFEIKEGLGNMDASEVGVS